MEKPLKRLSTFLILFIIVVSFGFIYYHHHEDGVSYDDCFFCSIIAYNKVFFTQDNYQVLSNYRSISPVLIDKDIITSFTLTHAISVRAPPI